MKIKLDRERKIRFNTAAIIEIEEQLNCSIFELIQGNMKLGTIVVVIWAGLEDDLDLEYVKEILPLNRLGEITEQIFKELTVAIGGDADVYDKTLADVKKKVKSTKISATGSEKLKETSTGS